jgi:hypothetical protein
MKPTAANIAKYVNSKLTNRGFDNIAIYLPGLNNNTITALKREFKSVTRQPFGYIKFER